MRVIGPCWACGKPATGRDVLKMAWCDDCYAGHSEPIPAEDAKPLSEEKKRMYKVSRPDYAGKQFCVFKDWGTVESEFDGAEAGDTIQIELVKMTDDEFEALGDFEGW